MACGRFVRKATAAIHFDVPVSSHGCSGVLAIKPKDSKHWLHLLIAGQSNPISQTTSLPRTLPIYKMMRYIFASFIFASLVVAAPVAGEWDPELAVRDNFYTLMRRAECSTIQGCHECVANGCGYSKTDFHCQAKKKDSVNPNLVITATACPHIDQIQGVFPAVNKDTSHNPDGKKAGVHTPEVKAEMDRIAGHVFHGDGSTSTTGGRHTSASFEKDNKGAKVTNHNEASHIKEYNGSKTVFDSDHYSETDIRNMCSVAIKLRLDDDKANAATKGQPKGFVVQSPHGHPVCVETFATGTGSCYPKGTGTPTEPLNHPC